MSHARPYFALPLVFGLAALAAWLTAEPVHTAQGATDAVGRARRQRDSVPMAAGTAEVVAQFEQEMLHPKLPPAEVHDEDWMEGIIARVKAREGMVVCGGTEFEDAYRWASEDPQAMFAWLIHEGGSAEKDRVRYVSTLFGQWMEMDMKAALAAASRIPGDLLRRQALACCIEQLAVNNPAKARELLVENLELLAADDAPSLFSGKAICDLLLSLPAGETRTRLLAGSLGWMTASPYSSSDEAILIWENSGEDFRRELVAAGFKCGKDHAARFAGLESMLREHAESTGKREDAESFFESYGSSWAARDFSAALEWTQAHLKGANRVEQSVALFGQAAGQNFDAVVEAWQQLPPGILKARAAGAILKSAPADRKSDAESLVQSLAEQDR